jgi:thiamine transport system substrate-binding protein
MRLRAPVLRSTLSSGLVLATALALLALLAACGSSSSPSPDAAGDVVLVTHDSWALPKSVVAAFERQSGYHLVVRASGDAGQLTNKLVLTAGDPDGDVSFGVDNTFAGRALGSDVFAAYTPPDLPASAKQYDVPDDGGSHLTPVDHSAVCVNVDLAWFRAHHLTPPATMDDLTEPAYKDLMVTEGASTSSVGMAFLLATIAKYGSTDTTRGPGGYLGDWQEYWRALLANGLKVDEGWDQAYDGDYTLGGAHGTRPIVVSYDSDPAYTVKDGTTESKALLDTCFGQVEYAGVLAGAHNPAGAKAFVDFLLTRQVQQDLPRSMYVFPVADGTPLPATWRRYAVQPTRPWTVGAATIDAHRDTWLQQWTDLVQQ